MSGRVGQVVDRAVDRLCESRVVHWATAVEPRYTSPLLPALWGLRRVWLVFGSWLLLIQAVPFTLAALSGSLQAENWAYLVINVAFSISVTFSMSSIYRSHRRLVEYREIRAELNGRYGL